MFIVMKLDRKNRYESYYPCNTDFTKIGSFFATDFREYPGETPWFIEFLLDPNFEDTSGELLAITKKNDKEVVLSLALKDIGNDYDQYPNDHDITVSKDSFIQLMYDWQKESKKLAPFIKVSLDSDIFKVQSIYEISSLPMTNSEKIRLMRDVKALMKHYGDWYNDCDNYFINKRLNKITDVFIADIFYRGIFNINRALFPKRLNYKEIKEEIFNVAKNYQKNEVYDDGRCLILEKKTKWGFWVKIVLDKKTGEPKDWLPINN